jgi:Ca-activated chloride channel family protein
MMIGTGFTQQIEGDKSLAPYFFVQSDDPSVDKLPLKQTKADVHISGVIADVQITQVYKNEGKSTLEAMYVFPASTRAAVYHMQMKIGERTLVAKIAKREDARQQYEQAREEGKSASLLEQHRPNVFQMNVANIIPGDEIIVQLKYTELLVPDNAVYRFVYPTVVGPRYSNISQEEAPTNENWVANPYLNEGKASTYDFDLKVNINAGMPIQDIRSTTHKIDIDYDSRAVAQIGLSPLENKGGNRDFILEYRLSGGQIQSGLLLFKGKEDQENFFLAMVQPPQGIRSEEIPPREYIFIVDVSGSMNGFPISISKKLLKNLISGLRRSDSFNVLLFASGSSLLAESSLPATEGNIQKAIQMIENERGSGGTEILPALNRALRLPRRDDGVSRTIVIATDGYVRVEKEAFDVIRNNLGEANVFVFGIGSSVNRYLLEGMARTGMGESFVITEPGKAEAQAEKFRSYINTPVLTGIQVSFDQFDAYDIEPPSLPDLLAQRPIIVFGKWKGNQHGRIRFKGMTGNQKKYESILNVSEFDHDIKNGALRYLWARHRIALLNDYNRVSSTEALKDEIVNLGLAYNLLTEFTSFVAIDSRVRNQDGQIVSVKQPLPLPQGVSNYAVGSGKGLAASTAFRKSHTADHSVMAEELAPAPVETRSEFVMGKLNIKSSVHAEAIRQTINSQLSLLSECLKEITIQNAKQEIILEFKIKQDGSVTDIRIISGGLSNPKLSVCLKKKIQAWKFGAHRQSELIIVRLPLTVQLTVK